MRIVILILFFLSGASSLIFETLWSRMLTLVFGSTTFAISTVVASFMGGLALGSYLVGKYSEKIRFPFLAYGIFESLVGIYALLFPYILSILPDIYKPLWKYMHLSFYPFSIARFILIFTFLLIPTTLMGGTLPILSKYLVKNIQEIGLKVGMLYAVNTFGAVCGTFLAGFLLLPNFGVTITNYIAFSINIILGLTVFIIFLFHKTKIDKDRKTEIIPLKEELPPSINKEYPTNIYKTVLILFMLSGCISMIYQMLWTRALVMVIGSSIYAFSIMLTTFLTGLSTGSYYYTKKKSLSNDPLGDLSFIQLMVAVTSFIGLLVMDYLPVLFLMIFDKLDVHIFTAFLVNFILCALIIFFPTFYMGMVFPAVIKIYGSVKKEVGKSVGNSYSLNTIGAILGSFAGGFIFIPFVGVERSLLISITLTLFIALSYMILRYKLGFFGKKHIFISILICSILFPMLYRPWNLHRMSSGAFRLSAYSGVINIKRLEETDSPSQEIIENNLSKWQKKAGETIKLNDLIFTSKEPDISTTLIFYKEGLNATVTSKHTISASPRSDVRWHRYNIETNGKPDASVTFREVLDSSKFKDKENPICIVGDEETQILLGIAPIVIHENPKDVFVLGYGSGMSVGSILQSDVENVEVAELEKGMVEGAKIFKKYNHDPESDKRVTINYNDGRNYLLLTEKKYDIISSEPSNPWIAGIGSLFTKEFFELVKERLKPDGLFVQWVQIYEMSPENVKTVINTLSTVFPHIIVFHSKYTMFDLILISSMEPIDINPQKLNKKFYNEKTKNELARVNINSPEQFLGYIVLTSSTIKDYVKNSRLNTDDNALLEFEAPKDLLNYRKYSDKEIINEIKNYFDNLKSYIDKWNLSPKEKEIFLLKLAESYLKVGEFKLAKKILTEDFPNYINEKKKLVEISNYLSSFELDEITKDILSYLRYRLNDRIELIDELSSNIVKNKFNEIYKSLLTYEWNSSLEPELFLILGYLSYLRNDLYKAFIYIKSASYNEELLKNIPWINFILGKIYYKLDRFDKMYQSFSDFYSSFSNHH